MSKHQVASLVALAVISLSGCDKPHPAVKADLAGLEPVLNSLSFYPAAEDGLKSSDYRFTSNDFKPLASHCWEFTTVRKCMALYSKDGDGSHASGAQIGGYFAEYNYVSKTWEVKAESMAFAVSGGWGEAPTPNFIRLGPDRYGVTLTSGSTNQGYIDEILSIYGISGKGIVEVLRMPILHSNALATEDESAIYGATVTLSQILDTSKDVYDLRARLTDDEKYDIDSDEDWSKLFEKGKEIILTFREGQFVPTGLATGKSAQ